jgi:hypothetical protein
MNKSKTRLIWLSDCWKKKGHLFPIRIALQYRLHKHPHMRELRVQHKGLPYRILYAFDPRRTAILLIGGNKTGNDRWYAEYVPVADRLYDEHLDELDEKG